MEELEEQVRTYQEQMESFLEFLRECFSTSILVSPLEGERVGEKINGCFAHLQILHFLLQTSEGKSADLAQAHLNVARDELAAARKILNRAKIILEKGTLLSDLERFMATCGPAEQISEDPGHGPF